MLLHHRGSLNGGRTTGHNISYHVSYLCMCWMANNEWMVNLRHYILTVDLYRLLCGLEMFYVDVLWIDVGFLRLCTERWQQMSFRCI